MGNVARKGSSTIRVTVLLALTTVHAATAGECAVGTGPAGTDRTTSNGVTVDVLTYGAVGDGHTDDTTALQAALDAVQALGGGTVRLPTGTYRISATLEIGSAVHLTGEGPNITFIEVATDVDAVQTTRAAQAWSLRDLSVIGGAGNDLAATAITIGEGNHGFRLKGIGIGGPGGSAFARGLEITAAWAGTVQTLQVADCSDYALYVRSGRDIHFERCEFSGYGLTACAYVGGDTCLFSECTFRGWPVGAHVTGDENVFTTSRFANDYPQPDLWCVHVDGGDYNSFVGGSYASGRRLSGGTIRISGSATGNRFIEPLCVDGPATAVDLHMPAQSSRFVGGNIDWSSAITADAGSDYSICGAETDGVLRPAWWEYAPDVRAMAALSAGGAASALPIDNGSSPTRPGCYEGPKDGRTVLDTLRDMALTAHARTSYAADTTGPAVAPAWAVLASSRTNFPAASTSPATPSSPTGTSPRPNSPTNTISLSSAPQSIAATDPENSGWFNVKDYGAKGDGITDDTKAIQAVIDAVPDGEYGGPGGVVLVPYGTYKITDELILDDGVTVRGVGPGSYIKQDTDDKAIFRGDTASATVNVVVEDLRLGVSGSATGVYGVRGRDTSYYWGNSSFKNIIFDPELHYGCVGCFANCRWEKCQFFNSNYGRSGTKNQAIYIEGTSGAKTYFGDTIVNCRFEAGVNCNGVLESGDGDSLTIIGSTFENLACPAYYAKGSYYTRFAGCQFENIEPANTYDAIFDIGDSESVNSYLVIDSCRIAQGAGDTDAIVGVEGTCTVDFIHNRVVASDNYWTVHTGTGAFDQKIRRLFDNEDNLTSTYDGTYLNLFSQPKFHTGVAVYNKADSAGYIDLYEGTGDGTNRLRIESQALSNDATMTLPILQRYTITNATTDRSFNANRRTVGELADVLATLIADLQSVGILNDEKIAPSPTDAPD